MTLKLIFEPNEFFENTELTCVVEYEYGSQVKKSTGTDIKWKPGKDITYKLKTLKKKANNKKKANKKKGKLNESVEVEVFLSLFDIFTKEYTFEDATKNDDAANPSKPNLFFVEEVVDAIGEIAGEDSLAYYLDCVHDEGLEGLEGMKEDMETIGEGVEDSEGDEDEETQTSGKNNNRKQSTKSGKSKKSKTKSRKNTEDKIEEAEVKVPSEPNEKECKQN